MMGSASPFLFPLLHGWSVGSQPNGLAPFMGGQIPLPAVYFTVQGVTKDSAGVALASCVVDLFRTADDVKVDQVVSGADGSFAFRTGAPPSNYYIVAYKAGSPDVTGATANTLTAAA